MSNKEGLIYCIKNKINNKKYIGQTVDLRRRWKEHKSSGKYPIQKAIKKYGKNNFNVLVLEENIKVKNLDHRERFWIKKYNTFEKGYNLTKGGQRREQTNEIKTKIRESTLGENNHMYDKTHELSTKRKISKTLKEIQGPNQKVNKDKMKKIYKLYFEENKTQAEIAMIIGVSIPTISRNLNKKYKTPDKYKNSDNKRINPRNRQIEKEVGVKIYFEYKNTNLTQRDLAKKYNLGVASVCEIVNKNHWTTKEI